MNRFAILLVCASPCFAQDLTVLPKDEAKQMMGQYLHTLANKAFEKRRLTYEALQTDEQIRAYQQRLRAFFLDQLGGLPKKTPLNARVVGRLEGAGCRIEKVLLESRPQHYVTATLYLPNAKPPYPAVLIPCGHTIPGKASNQRLSTFLAQNGLAAFTYDPIGQGERFQFLTEQGKPRYKSTTEHTLVGVSSILVGRNTASYRIWDGMRCLDYLQSRDDIDDSHLGCTGVSGGGTLTEYLMALDDRIVAAAPACAPTTFQRRFATIGPGDAEQNIFGQVAFGLDHADYTILRAPKPTLLLTATRDFVDIRGSWDLFREAKRLYARMGYPERIELIEADAKHGFSKPLRVGAVRWMRRWLLDKDDAVEEPEITTRPIKDLLCTETGQVQRLDGARSVMDLNMDVVRACEAQRKTLWEPEHREKALAKVRSLAGIRPLDEIPIPKDEHLGSVERDNARIEKLVLRYEDIALPGLLYVPKKSSGQRILYVHGLGKQADANPGGTIEKLVDAGCLVLAVDLRGIGETGASKPNLWGGSFDDFFIAYLLGKSHLGMRAEDILVSARYLSAVGAKESKPVKVVAVGIAGPPALHAVALEPSLFAKLTLRDSLRSWKPMVEDPTQAGKLINVVHGALCFYDLTDLVNSLPKAKINVLD